MFQLGSTYVAPILTKIKIDAVGCPKKKSANMVTLVRGSGSKETDIREWEDAMQRSIW